MNEYLTAERADGTLRISPKGDWVFANAACLQQALDEVRPSPGLEVAFRCGGLREFDLAGAWILYEKSMDFEEPGRLTTIAVVQSIFLIIVADALFTIVYARIGF